VKAGQAVRTDNGLSQAFGQLPRTLFWWTFHALARVPVLRGRSRKGLVRGWYEVVSAFDRAGNVTFLNYGYASLDADAGRLALPPEEERNRYCIQLYEYVAGRVDLRGRDVLEVGSGRGGGSNFLMRHFEPKTVTGIDLAQKAIDFCRQRYARDGLTYVQGDAERIPFPDCYFDAVVNVESSHNYPNMALFVREVHRVLRPEGYFLFADHRPAREVDTVRRDIMQSGLEICEDEQIARNVIHALELDSDRRLGEIRRKVPRFLQPTVAQFSGVRGSELYEKLRSLELDYIRILAQKVSHE
jgi:ubiquinone/menaquinone biosynthesis C-methylase UbiE